MIWGRIIIRAALFTLLIKSDLIGKPYLVSMLVVFRLYIFFLLFVALLNTDR